MSSPTIEIKRSVTNDYYELYISGNLVGTYGTAVEAANDIKYMIKEEENKNETH